MVSGIGNSSLATLLRGAETCVERTYSDDFFALQPPPPPPCFIDRMIHLPRVQLEESLSLLFSPLFPDALEEQLVPRTTSLLSSANVL